MSNEDEANQGEATQADSPRHDTNAGKRRGSDLTQILRDRIAVRRTIAGEVISLANLLGRPVTDPDGNRVGKVNDVAVRWDAGTDHPRVSGVLIAVGKGLALVDASEVTLTQSGARLPSTRTLVAMPVRVEGDIALARDVLDHQLVDVEGVQVVRAADVYLVRMSDGWLLAGIDVGVQAYTRRVLRKRRHCPPPSRMIDWADLQTFVAGAANSKPPGRTGPAAAAGVVGSGLQLGTPAKDLHRLRAREVAEIISHLGRKEQAQVASLAAPSAAAEALRGLDPTQRDALLAELSEPDRARLSALLSEDGPE